MRRGSSVWVAAIAAALGAGGAMVLLGAPLGTVLLAGLVLVCPLAMAGMHGDRHHPVEGAGEPKPQPAPRLQPSSRFIPWD